MSTQKPRLKQILQPCVEDITVAKVVPHPSEGVGLTLDVTKAHKRLRIREDELGKLYHYTVYLFWSKIQRRVVEPHGSSTHPHLPPLPLYVDDFLFRFGGDNSAALGNVHLLFPAPPGLSHQLAQGGLGTTGKMDRSWH